MPREDEAALKVARSYGAVAQSDAMPEAHNHFGHVVVSCDRADFRPLPHGVVVYGDEAQRFESVPPPVVPRAEVIDELCDAVDGTRRSVHDGEWGKATLEACLAILASSRQGGDVALAHQVPVHRGGSRGC